MPQGGGARRPGGRGARPPPGASWTGWSTAFGREHLAVELWDHGDPLDTARNDALALLAAHAGVDAVATNNVHYATPAGVPPGHHPGRRPGPAAPGRAGGLAARRPPRPACARRPSRPGASPAGPGVVERAGELGAACAFDLRLVAPRLPDFPVPEGMDEQGYLRQLVERGGHSALRARAEAERVPGAWAQIDHELEVIGGLGFAGYFLVVWDIAEFCRRWTSTARAGARPPTRPSATPSASPTSTPSRSACSSSASCRRPATGRPTSTWTSSRAGVRRSSSTSTSATAAATPPRWPTSSPTGPARPCATSARRSGTRPSRWTPGPSAIDRGHRAARPRRGRRRGPDGDATGIPPLVAELAAEVLDRPRHLGIHSAGMVLCDRPVMEVCPVEWGRMPGRSVLQWDKDDCAAIGLVKFDLLGLGMLEALHRMVDLVGEHHGVPVDLGGCPRSPRSTTSLCRADTVGVFQVESRAQMGTLPRVAAPLLLRPGDRGGADPARAHPGPRGQPLHPPPAGRGAGHLPAPAARAHLAGARSGSRCSKSS